MKGPVILARGYPSPSRAELFVVANVESLDVFVRTSWNEQIRTDAPNVVGDRARRPYREWSLSPAPETRWLDPDPEFRRRRHTIYWTDSVKQEPEGVARGHGVVATWPSPLAGFGQFRPLNQPRPRVASALYMHYFGALAGASFVECRSGAASIIAYRRFVQLRIVRG